MSAINYTDKIPNNVNLSEDKTLQRELEHWQPNYINWWKDMGPEGSNDYDVYLRTAVSVDPQGWANFGHVKMPDYRWGIFMNQREEGRTVNFGEHKGEAAWQDVPGEHRANLRRIIARATEMPQWRQTVAEKNWNVATLIGKDFADSLTIEQAMAEAIAMILKLKA